MLSLVFSADKEKHRAQIIVVKGKFNEVEDKKGGREGSYILNLPLSTNSSH